MYFPGLSGPFLLDDYANILDNEGLRMRSWSDWKQASLSGIGGFLGRPLSMASFALNAHLSGFSPYGFKLTNLLIHLANAIALFFLTRLLAESYARLSLRGECASAQNRIALGVALLWAFHPLNLTPVLYVVQRMTSLSSLFTVASLICYTWARLRMGEPTRLHDSKGVIALWLGVPIFGGLGFLAKETAALLPLYFLVLETTLFHRPQADSSIGRQLAAIRGGFIALPLLAGGIYAATHLPMLLGMYTERPFTLPERLLTECRVLWYYLRLILLPDISVMGLFHDDFPISKGLSEPVSTLFSAAGLLALMAGSLRYRKRAPLISFGLLWFIAGQSLESSFLPLELVFEHRNYLPSYGILLPVGYWLFHARQQHDRVPAPAVGLVILLFLGVTTHTRASLWSNEFILATTEAEQQPKSARATLLLAWVYMEIFSRSRDSDIYHTAYALFQKAHQLDPSHPRAMSGLILLNARAGAPPEPEWIQSLGNILGTRQLAPDALKYLAELEICQKEGSCHLKDAEMMSLFGAVLNNPKLTSIQKADVFAQWGDYEAFHLGKAREAVTFLSHAVQLNPSSVNYRWSLVQLLILTKQFDMAQPLLDSLGAEPRHRLSQERLDALRGLMQDARMQSSRPDTH